MLALPRSLDQADPHQIHDPLESRRLEYRCDRDVDTERLLKLGRKLCGTQRIPSFAEEVGLFRARSVSEHRSPSCFDLARERIAGRYSTTTNPLLIRRVGPLPQRQVIDLAAVQVRQIWEDLDASRQHVLGYALGQPAPQAGRVRQTAGLKKRYKLPVCALHHSRVAS